jgi:hypothetical protein
MTVRVYASFHDAAIASTLPRLSTATAKRFLQADEAVLILVRSDCPRCADYLAHADAVLGGMLTGAAVAALVLHRPGGARFRCDNPSIGGLGVFPYLVRYRRGCRIAGFAASGAPDFLPLLATRFAVRAERAA